MKPERGNRLIQRIRRAFVRVVWPELLVTESKGELLDQILKAFSPPPMQTHTRASVTALSLGVAAVYGGQVEGDIAEFGTMTGQTAIGLARGLFGADEHLGYALDIAELPRKSLHLFDSFEGLPQTDNPVDNISPHVRSGAWAPGTCVGLSQDELLKQVCAHFDQSRVRIFAGWFSETLKTLPFGTKYALVHIDSDLYASAHDVLEHLFANHMITRGAHIFFDDWNCNGASPDLGERRAWSECVEKFRVDFSDEGGYGVFGHKFIVHSYG
jgi:O-methyltransferase